MADKSQNLNIPQNLELDSANLPCLVNLKFVKVRGILLFAKAKRSKKFYFLGASHGLFFH